tara:strand:- start:2419 stop:2571 length:153 start_codon:yes stop_codon:yes gene_type:complete
MKTEEEMQEMADKAREADPNETRGMTYLDGIQQALAWALGQIDEADGEIV